MNVTTACPVCGESVWAEPGPDSWDEAHEKCEGCGSVIAVGLEVTTRIVSRGTAA